VTFCNGVIANDSAFQLGRQKEAAHNYNGPLMHLRMTFRNGSSPSIDDAPNHPARKGGGQDGRFVFWSPVTNYFRSLIA
jgi:hypothetical protein